MAKFTPSLTTLPWYQDEVQLVEVEEEWLFIQEVIWFHSNVESYSWIT